MNKEALKKEAISLLLLFAAMFVLLQIVFFKESPLTTIRTVFALFWLFTLPGYAIMLYWQEKLGFIERAIIGTVLGAAIIGVIGYNLGVLGIKMNTQIFLIPLACIAIGAFISYRKK